MTFIVMNRSAQVRGRAKQFGPYRHVAVVEVEEGFVGEPSMISDRAKGVVRVVYDSGAVHSKGTTMRSRWQRELAHVQQLCAELNAGASS